MYLFNFQYIFGTLEKEGFVNTQDNINRVHTTTSIHFQIEVPIIRKILFLKTIWKPKQPKPIEPSS